MKIASWNVNSIKVRLEHVKNWLGTNSPDLLLLQELKGLEFPSEAFEGIGYKSEFVNQKTYNGVAILSKEPLEIILDRLSGDDADEQARYLEVSFKNIRVINIYLPNGNPIYSTSSSCGLTAGSQASEEDTLVKPKHDIFNEKYIYKLGWMDRLYHRLSELRKDNIPFVIGGDFNVIPEDKDCHDPKAWEGDALFRPETHAKWRALLNLGLTDAFRVNNMADNNYSFWDYQRGAWPRNKGIRIDHFLMSPQITDKLASCTIDKAPRGEEKASDHTPIVLELNT